MLYCTVRTLGGGCSEPSSGLLLADSRGRHQDKVRPAQRGHRAAAAEGTNIITFKSFNMI